MKKSEMMQALAVTGVEEIELVEMPIPETKSDEVLVKVAYCGVCGSDLPRYFNGGVHAFPQILGHEFSGVVEKVGQNVKHLQPGDRVAVAPLLPLTPPEDWAGNNPAMGEKYSFIGSRQPGAMAEYVAVAEKNCVVVPDDLSLEKAALVEPLTVAIHGVDRLDLKSGAKTLVLGSGTIGLLTIAVLRTRGVGEIIAVDINDSKLEAAKNMGADIVINSKTSSLTDYFEQESLPEIVIETAGSMITQKQAIEFVAKTGQICYLGTVTQEITFQPNEFEQILRKEIRLTGAWMSYSTAFPGYEWDAAMRYMNAGQINTDSFITGHYKLSDKAAPFEDMVAPNSEHIKVLYQIDPNA